MQERTIGGWLAVAGSLGVVVITAIYASAPPEASAPLPPGVSFQAALAATLTASAKLRVAGTIGIVADILLIAGCALLMRDTTPLKRLLWLWVGLSTAIFIAVDSLASQVIPAVAEATRDDLGAFILARKTFDVSFVLGVLTFGLAFIVAGMEQSFPRWLRTASLAAGALSIAAFGLSIAGVVLPLLLGAAVFVAGLFGIVFGYREARA